MQQEGAGRPASKSEGRKHVLAGMHRRKAQAAARQHKKKLSNARGLMLGLGLFIIIITGANWLLLQPASWAAVDESWPTIMQLVLIGFMAYGGILVLLSFWAKKKPFEASLVALCIYLLPNAALAIAYPAEYFSNILLLIIAAINILTLLGGMKSGLRFKRMQRKEMEVAAEAETETPPE